MFEPTEQGKDLCIHTGVVLRGGSTREDEVHSLGTLNVVEYSFGKCIEWKPMEDSVVSENQDQDPEWSLVDTHTRRTRTSSEGPDSLGRTRNVRILFSDLNSFRLNHGGQQLIFMLKDGTTYVAFFQLSNAESFVNSLKGFIRFVKSRANRNLYIVVDEVQTVLTKSFAELDLFQENTSDYVWKFVKNLQNRPYETTLEAFSKLSDIWLYKEPARRPVEEAVADILNNSLSIDVPHPPVSIGSGEEYEVIGEHGLGVILPPRSPCPRGSPLSQEQWDKYKDSEGRILNPQEVKEVIFRGGVAPSLRFEVWKFLLNYYPWNSTHIERLELRKKKTDEYFMMKLQWRSMTSTQENNFSDYRDRKSLIEKDVNRTDRTHPYYMGDNNPHLAQLYDILMTYVMYNFDLGYVQGMSDLLSPILCLMESEVDAFWSFVGFMDKVCTNFDIDQAGMKDQLCQLYTLLSTTDPQLAHYLNMQDSGNMFFCFRWLLVLFKREFNALDIMKLWEILWTGLPCKNFHLLLCLAILDTERSMLMENRYGFTEILKHINDLSLHIELPWMLSKAEGIYYQLMSVADQLPDNVRTIIGLEPSNKTPSNTIAENGEASGHDVEAIGDNTNSRRNSRESGNVKLGDNEVSFERGLNLSYM
ncbi:TBC1 domain family member 15-like [Hylaeus anthracinus]|uniref:TBC1 domain family member 15-like n=1 Tax=Hylaeus volcanicus TaxID=313075 RepID=UPI0023B7FFCE|nr:TBC1 domain family member 15-like [Hylaeus volcanicus]XP_053978197.1 TBC1 domain family member 15-like [Hylaeus volcanicus]XP_054002978.1 TBC1 domain family member 15-like [Hylaeus anthracinus]